MRAAALFLLLGSAPALAAPMKTVAKLALPWKAGAKPYVAVLELPKDWNDPGDYTRLTIHVPGQKDFVLDELQAGETRIQIDRKAIVEENHWLKLVDLGRGPRNRVLLATNWNLPDYDQLMALALDAQGRPFVAYRRDVISRAVSLRDFDGDGLRDLVIEGGHGEPVGGGGIFSYDPYLILPWKSVTFEVDEALSRKWSASRGFEWHGPRYDEHVTVRADGKVAK